MSGLAIQGGAPVRTEPWPAWPVHDESEESAVVEAIRAGDWGGYPMPNKYAERFSANFARHHDCAYGQCVANGTVSLEIALQAAGVEPGSEVIVPAYTFEGTAAAVLFAGCVPVFVDVEPETYCISPGAVEAAITGRTQAIIPVHLAMRIADMDRLNEIAARRGLIVLEDCAHAHGAKWKGKGVGSLGNVGSFSFQTTKLMTAGEGGILITNDAKIMDYLYALTNCGRQRPGKGAEAPVIGHNYRMTDIQAAILEVQLTRLDAQHEQRNRNMAVLDEGLPEIEGLSTLRWDERITTQAAYQYVFRYDPAPFGGLPRDVFVAALNAEGIPCDGRFYEPVFNSPFFLADAKRYPAWADSKADPDCPVAWRAGYEEAVWLPHHIFLCDRAGARQILEAIRKVCDLAPSLRGFEHPSIQTLRLSRSQRDEIEAKERLTP